ncbi:tetratricopeptide repeat protein [Roseiconus lacunae]|uniref:tetratricopeptide repeat protein n=1 Tax=Roseiconus lacunae TaxID=2605694 RepID=UPI0011F34A42|nr:tetratricopeptide repeat protein [Roseiconus lacunae]
MKNLVCLPITLILLGSSAFGEEPAQAFLDGLRERGYHDVAMAYLDQMANSRLASAELKSTIPYEKSLLLIDRSRKQRDPKLRAEQLDQARQWLDEFIRTQASHAKVNSARSQLGTLIVERARMQYDASEVNNDPELKTESLRLYDQSFEVFAQLQSAVKRQLDEIPKVLNTRDRKEAQLIAKRKQLRADFLQTEMYTAAIREELAELLPVGSAEQRKCLTEAAGMYDGIYKDYRTLLAGRYARLYQGRCFLRLGRTKEALGYFGEILDLSNEPEALMTLKAKALVMALETWLSPEERKYIEAIKQASRWLDETPDDRQREKEWIAIRFHLARALKMRADEAKRDRPANRLLISQSLEAAREALQLVAAESGELKQPAQELLTQLGGAEASPQEQEPDTFTAAQTVAKEAMDLIAPASSKIASLTASLQNVQNDQEKKSFRDQIDEANRELVSAEERAIHYYQLALQLADEQTPQSNVNLVQYFLSYLYFVKGDFYDAAVVADFVARRFPNSPGARQCAKISVGSYLKLLEQASDSGTDSEFEIQRLYAVGSYMHDTWPDDPNTPQTLATLIPHLINSGAVLRAAELVRKLPESSEVRGGLELITGQSLWGKFLELQRSDAKAKTSAVPSSDESPQQGTAFDGDMKARLATLKGEAKSMILAGYERLPEEPTIDQASATAMLSLSQIYVEDQQFDRAIEILEDPTLGPLTLLKAGHAAVSNPVYAEEAYQTALRSYVASLGDGGQENMGRVNQAIESMREVVGNDEAGKRRMLGVYVTLAQDVQRRMESASSQEKNELSTIFEAFLAELSNGATEVGVLQWVGDTLATLADGFGTDDRQRALRLYQKADDSFQRVLSQGSVDHALKNQVQVRLAGIKYQLGDFQGALSLYQTSLKRDPKAINIQTAAARFLQSWGNEDPSRFEQAIEGVDPIWGWAKIAISTAQYEQFRETFYEARYELARCQIALAKSSADKSRQRLLRDARRVLNQTVTLYPNLGAWKPKYDSLIRSLGQ